MLELNTVHHGDCYQLVKELPDECVSLVFVDIAVGERKWLPEASRVMRVGAAVVIGCQNDTDAQTLSDAMEPVGIEATNFIMNKDLSDTKVSDYWTVGYKGKPMFLRQLPFLLEYKRPEGRVFEFERSVQTMEVFVRALTYEQELVLDLFAGTATMGVAAITNNREYIGFEKEKIHYEYAKERIKKCVLGRRSD